MFSISKFQATGTHCSFFIECECMKRWRKVLLAQDKIEQKESATVGVRESCWCWARIFYIILSLALSLPAPLPAPLLWGCSRFNCYEICRSREEQKMSCQSLCSGDSYHMKAGSSALWRRCWLAGYERSVSGELVALLQVWSKTNQNKVNARIPITELKIWDAY